MSGEQSEELFHPWGDNLDPFSDSAERHPNQLAPMSVDRQQNYDQGHYYPLPSIPLYGIDYHPQHASQAIAHSHNASSQASIDPALDLLVQLQQFFHEEEAYQQRSPDKSYSHSQQSSSSIYSIAAHDQHHSQPSLSAPTDHFYQQISPYTELNHNQQLDQSRSGTPNYPCPPSLYHPLSFQTLSSDAVHPPLSVQRPPPTFSNSPKEQYPLQSSSDLSMSHDSQIQIGEAEFYANLAAVSGVVTPSQLAPGQAPIQPSGSRSSGKNLLSRFCSICGAAFEKNYVQSHCKACVARNGNPSGARKDDSLHTPRIRTEGRCDTRGASEKVSKDIRPTLPVSQPNASAPQSSDLSLAPRFEPSERAKKRNDRLDAVNGIIIPSKLAIGELPKNLKSQASPNTPLHLLCPLCKGAFGKTDHVRSHFPACVDRNGNPSGLRWDDGLPLTNRGPKPTYNRAGGEDVAGSVFRWEAWRSSRQGQQRSRSLSPRGCFD